MPKDNETEVYISEAGWFFKTFAILCGILLLVLVVELSIDYGKRQFREDLREACRYGDPFTIDGFEGLFSCYRLDVEERDPK